MLIYLDLIETESDRNKFILLYERYGAMMYSLAFKTLENEQDAEDAVHQAFLNVIDMMPKIRDAESSETKALMMLLVSRRASDILRKRSKIADFDAEKAVVETDFADRLNGGLARALSRINPRYCRVILLRYSYGYSTREIAGMLDMKRNTVQKLLIRARKALKEELEKENEDE